MKSLRLPLRQWLRYGTRAAEDLLFPPRCISCRVDMRRCSDGIMLCGSCRRSIRLITWPTCGRCAAPVPEWRGVRLDCSHCRNDKLQFARTLALGSYEDLLRTLVMRMKTDRNQLVARTLAKLAWRELGPRLADLQVDLVTSVPMHRWRRLRRGTNAPHFLACQLAEKLQRPAARVLTLVRNVPAQVGLSRPARFRNITGEMKIRAGYHLKAARILLVDDILTTGATCSEAARVLRRAGAAEVSVFVLARTPAE